MNRSLLKYYFEWCCIITYSIILGVYALSKGIQFENRLNIATPVNELSAFRLMWAFYGQSITYPIIIGVFQLLSIILIIPRTTRLFGCILGTVILSNIILQDIIYAVPRGALFNALFLQILILLIFFFNRRIFIEKLKSILITETTFNLKEIRMKQKIKMLITAIICFIIFALLLQGIWIIFNNFYYFKNLIIS